MNDVFGIFPMTIERPRSRADIKAQQQETTRRYILDLARQMVIEHGYDGLTLRRLAEAAGYAPGTIYLYFKNRDDIARAVAGEIYRDLLATLKPAAASAPPGRQLEALLHAYARFARDNPAAYRLAFVEDPHLVTQPVELADAETAAQSLALLTEGVREILPEGSGDDTHRLAESAWLAMHGVAAILVSCPGYDADSPDAVIDTMVRLIVAGIKHIDGR